MGTDEPPQVADALENAFHLAYYLHPDEAIVWHVLQDACEHGELALKCRLAERQRKVATYQRKGREGWEDYRPYKQAIPAENLLQVALYRVSLTWEYRQEQTRAYRPTRADQLIRYIKHLVWKAIEQNPCHAAVGLGHFLYTYVLADIGALEATWPREHNLERAAQRIRGWITDRCGTISMRSPANHDERALVHASLSVFAPWFPPCDAISTTRSDTASRAARSQQVLQLYFAGDESSATAWQQMHVLIHPCVGVEQLIQGLQAWGEERRAMEADDPETTLRLPMFGPSDDRPPDGAGSPLGDRLRPPPLTIRERMTLREKLDHNRHRRRQFRAGASPLRVDVDGRPVGPVGVAATPEVPVPLTASFVELFGRDAEGDLRLAVFSLPELEGEESRIRQRVTLEGRQTVTMELLPSDDNATGEVTGGRMRIIYEEPPAVYVFPLLSGGPFAVAAASETARGVQGLPGEMMYQDAELEVWLNVEDGRIILRVYGEDVEGLGALEALDDTTLDAHPVVTIARGPTEVAYALGSTQDLRGKRVRLSLRLHEHVLELPRLDLPGEAVE